MLYLRTRRGLTAAIHAARLVRAKHGPGLSFARNVADDGAFNFSIWKGTTYLGVLGTIS